MRKVGGMDTNKRAWATSTRVRLKVKAGHRSFRMGLSPTSTDAHDGEREGATTAQQGQQGHQGRVLPSVTQRVNGKSGVGSGGGGGVGKCVKRQELCAGACWGGHVRACVAWCVAHAGTHARGG